MRTNCSDQVTLSITADNLFKYSTVLMRHNRRMWQTTSLMCSEKNNLTETFSNVILNESLIVLYLNIENAINMSSVNFTDLLNADFIDFADSAATSTSSSSLLIILTLILSLSSSIFSLSFLASDSDSCSDWYKFFYDFFQICESIFNVSIFDMNSSGLKIQFISFVTLWKLLMRFFLQSQIQDCDDLINWHFEKRLTDLNFQWYTYENLLIEIKMCVEQTVISADSQSADDCTDTEWQLFRFTLTPQLSYWTIVKVCVLNIWVRLRWS